MIALNLLEVKECMEKLLLRDDFNSFSFIEGTIATFATFSLDGYLKRDFYNSDEQEALTSVGKTHADWADMKEYCFHIIKGKQAPLSFKFVLSLSKENTAKLLTRDLPHISVEQVQGLYFNFQFEKGTLECITGTSMKTFSMDKSLDHIWDETAMKFLKQKEILFEKL